LTDLVIKAVEKMAEDQGITTLKLTGCNKVPMYPADWIAGVEYKEENEEEDNTNEDENPKDDDLDEELDNEEAYDRIDPEEIDDLNNDPGMQRQSNLPGRSRTIGR
jgi:hypothetical protein